MIITTVTPVKIFKTESGLSRDTDRLDLQLASLRDQRGKFDLEPIISDMSDSKEVNDKIAKICKKYRAKHIVTHANLIWSKPLCLNIGIKNSNPLSEYIATLDADIVFSNNVFAKCVRSIKNHPKNVACLSRTFMLNESKIEKDFSYKKFQEYITKGSFLNLSGNGGIQFFDKNWIFKVRGYDERFNLWGGIDNEIIKRVSMDGRKYEWISDNEKDDILLIHLSHPRFQIPGISKGFISKYKKENNVPIYKNDNSIIRNKKAWGNPDRSPGLTWNNLR